MTTLICHITGADAHSLGEFTGLILIYASAFLAYAGAWMHAKLHRRKLDASWPDYKACRMFFTELTPKELADAADVARHRAGGGNRWFALRMEIETIHGFE